MDCRRISLVAAAGRFPSVATGILTLAALSLGGCWSGETMDLAEMEYAHRSVKWVYRSGGQVGMLLHPMDSCIYDLQHDELCVVVEEYPFGYDKAAMWKPRWAIDVETGEVQSRKRSKPPKRNTNIFADPISGVGWIAMVDDETIVYISNDCRQLDISMANRPTIEKIRLLALPEDGNLGTSLQAIRPREDLLVLAMKEGYVICIDLTKLPTLKPDASATATDDKSISVSELTR